ncbi:MAG: DISARM system SNF2-like helicase DrmD, partial [Chroococcales cyanobacterium]
RQLRRKRGLHINPWTHFPRLITSIDFLKRDRALGLFRDVLPAEGESIYPRRFDLLIVDEAHNIAPPGSGKYAIDSQRTSAIRLLAPHFEHKLFLTATPHNGYPESFTALLELLDSQRFARGVEPDKKQLQVVMVRRLKSELPPKWDGTPRFPERKLEAIPVDYTSQERQMNHLLNEYGKQRRQGAKNNHTEQYATEFVLKLLKKRLFSSPAAFLTTIEKHQNSLQKPQEHLSSRLSQPTVGILKRQLEYEEQDFTDDAEYEEFTESAIASTSPLFRELNSTEQQYLDQMKDLAEQVAQRPDTKARELLNWIHTYICPHGEWSQKRVIIFTEYRTTQKWLYDLLASQGLASDKRLLTIYGGMTSEEREQVKAAFQASPEIAKVRILLATDAAAEGLDLQNYCSALIHYEIPWNPNRMEQRNGRIDRHGQKSPQVWIYHFVGKDYQSQTTVGQHPGDLEGDLEFLMRAAIKVNNIREDLGKVGPVIANQVEEAMLGKRRQLETTTAERNSEPVRRMLKFERKVRDQIQKLREQLQETRQNLHLTPENIESVVKIGLDLAEQPPLIPVEGETGLYYLPALKGSWARCSEGLPHPHTGEIRPISFNPDLVKGRDDVVLIHLNHRLVQMCLRLLRAEVWSNHHGLHRASAEIIPSFKLEYPAVIAYGRLLILGGDSQRLHEEVITAGGVLKAGQFSRLNIMKIREALQSVTEETVPEGMQQRLLALWDNYEKPLLRSLEVRMEERTKGLEKSLQERCEKEVADLTAVLEELQNRIRQELESAQKPKQLELFSNEEREQFERNRNSLERRLEQIPTEIEQETQVIRDRFANPKPRLFPLALKFLVPKNLI